MTSATLDHVVINARDELDEACAIYSRLGFNLTERGYHKSGSMLHLAIFGTDYLELLGLPRGGTQARRDLLDYPKGLNGLVFGSEEASETFKLLKTKDAPFDAPVEISRPVTIDGVTEVARIRGIFMKPGFIPYGRIYFCHHMTRQFIWRDEWRRHDNGVVAIQRMVIVEPDPEIASRVYAKTFGEDSIRDCKGGKTVIAGNSHVDIVTEETFLNSFGAASPDPQGRRAYMAGLTLRTVSLTKTSQALSR
jgi:hypothetical protein